MADENKVEASAPKTLPLISGGNARNYAELYLFANAIRALQAPEKRSEIAGLDPVGAELVSRIEKNPAKASDFIAIISRYPAKFGFKTPMSPNVLQAYYTYGKKIADNKSVPTPEEVDAVKQAYEETKLKNKESAEADVVNQKANYADVRSTYNLTRRSAVGKFLKCALATATCFAIPAVVFGGLVAIATVPSISFSFMTGAGLTILGAGIVGMKTLFPKALAWFGKTSAELKNARAARKEARKNMREVKKQLKNNKSAYRNAIKAFALDNVHDNLYQYPGKYNANVMNEEQDMIPVYGAENGHSNSDEFVNVNEFAKGKNVAENGKSNEVETENTVGQNNKPQDVLEEKNKHDADQQKGQQEKSADTASNTDEGVTGRGGETSENDKEEPEKEQVSGLNVRAQNGKHSSEEENADEKVSDDNEKTPENKEDIEKHEEQPRRILAEDVGLEDQGLTDYLIEQGVTPEAISMANQYVLENPNKKRDGKEIKTFAKKNGIKEDDLTTALRVFERESNAYSIMKEREAMSEPISDEEMNALKNRVDSEKAGISASADKAVADLKKNAREANSASLSDEQKADLEEMFSGIKTPDFSEEKKLFETKPEQTARAEKIDKSELERAMREIRGNGATLENSVKETVENAKPAPMPEITEEQQKADLEEIVSKLGDNKVLEEAEKLFTSKQNNAETSRRLNEEGEKEIEARIAELQELRQRKIEVLQDVKTYKSETFAQKDNEYYGYQSNNRMKLRDQRELEGISDTEERIRVQKDIDDYNKKYSDAQRVQEELEDEILEIEEEIQIGRDLIEENKQQATPDVEEKQQTVPVVEKKEQPQVQQPAQKAERTSGMPEFDGIPVALEAVPEKMQPLDKQEIAKEHKDEVLDMAVQAFKDYCAEHPEAKTPEIFKRFAEKMGLDKAQAKEALNKMAKKPERSNNSGAERER